MTITQYSSNSGGGVRTTHGSEWGSAGFAQWTVHFSTPFASMTTSFSHWSALSLEVSAQHSVASATQSTQNIVGDVGFRVDRRHLLTISGNLGVQVVQLPSGDARPSGSILERDVPYALRFNHGTTGVGFTTSASSLISLTIVIPSCAGDVTGNGYVDGTDLATLLSSWSTPGLGEFVTDVNADGIVDGTDLAFVLGGWGPCQ